ncbi:Probable calcium-binding protein CML45 [Striga hermonthica]|uniref:Probable calcium-binding protein CML45 n=1 Tax=Striga hermonthica TaxID=68872 RepID=A0A9N7R9M5_STRHE|nr:Probable calcium-binding protein CML45 [Striga hermonthica]
MEDSLANIISFFLVFQFKSLKWEIENFVPKLHFLLQAFSSKWNNSFWGKLQISKTSGSSQAPTENKEISRGEKVNLEITDASLVVNRLGIGGGLEDNGEFGGFCEKNLLALFDEVEPSLEEIKETFGAFDANGDGFINGSELQIVFCNLGLKCNLEECGRMIEKFDCNGDGLIDFREFVKLMENCFC